MGESQQPGGRPAREKDGARKDVLRVLDGAARAVRFNRELLLSAMENVDHGVNVIDAGLRLVAWNSRFVKLFRYPPGFLRVGLPLAEMIRFLAPPGAGEDEIAAMVESRLEPIRRGKPYIAEREFHDGTVVKVVATPMTNGRYLMTFSDITEQHTATHALTEANEQLEARLATSRQELSAAIEELAAARDYAERAALSQARFLAAASHDLLQPLQAARLFVATAAEAGPRGENRELLVNAETAIATADRMMRALLGLSQYEVRGKKPSDNPVDMGALLLDLERQLAPMAKARGLRLRVVPTARFALSDRDLLRSVIQNLVVNAIRYTVSGSVVVGCRADPAGLRVEVRDSGPGIASGDVGRAFREFSRLTLDQNKPGAGLGLSIADRICGLLGHDLSVRTAPGMGSIFAVALAAAAPVAPVRALHPPARLRPGFRILCVDADPGVRQGLKAMFTQWGLAVSTASTMGEACALAGPWDAVISGYELGDDGNGLDLIEVLFDSAPVHALLAATPGDAAMERAAGLGIEVIRKPAAPSVLRAFLSRAMQAAPAAAS